MAKKTLSKTRKMLGGKKNAKKLKIPDKPLPVTLLSGFLGSGKTTLLQNILRSEHGYRIAVVVNDIGAINIDAALIRKTHQLIKTDEKVIALQNGCICCTLRGDLLEELVRLAQLEEFDYIIIESSGISEPEQVAETFDARLAEHMGTMATDSGALQLDENMIGVLKQLHKAGGLHKFARLDTTVTVIDAFTMLQDFDTADLLSSRRNDVTAEDERTVSDLMVDQIEFADVIVLNKLDMISEETKEEAKSLIKKLNHRAQILESTYGRVDVKQLINTGSFRLEIAQSGYGWLQDLHAMTVREVNGRNVLTPKPETEEYNVQSFIYSRYRPFHPRRLFALIHDKFILQMEQPDEEDESETESNVEDEEIEEAVISYRGQGEERSELQTDNEAMDIDSDGEDTSENGTTTSWPMGAGAGALSASPGSSSTAETVPSTGTVAEQFQKLTTDAEGSMDIDPLNIPPNDVVLSNKRAHPLFRRLFRSKGEYFLATRPQRAGDWSQAGAMLTMTGGRSWFCTLDPSEYTTGDKEVDALVQHDIAKGGEWGDRRQELVFIGEKLNHAELEAVLDTCLLTDEEYRQWQQLMRNTALNEAEKREALEEIFEDGFPDWSEDAEDEDISEADAPDREHQHEHARHTHRSGKQGQMKVKK